MHVCMHVCVYVCVYVCMYVCMYVHTYACMYVCMYVCTYYLRYSLLRTDLLSTGLAVKMRLFECIVISKLKDHLTKAGVLKLNCA